MKKNIVYIAVLVIIYFVICFISLKLSYSDSSSSMNFVDSSIVNEMEILDAIAGNPTYKEDDMNYRDIYLKSEKIDSWGFYDYYDEKSPKYKVIFTDNNSYDSDLKDNGVINYESLKTNNDYETTFPIFKDESYKKLTERLIKDYSKKDESKEDLLVVIVSDKKVVDSFYIDGRLVDYSDILHKSDDFNKKGNSYIMKLVENEKPSNPCLKLMLSDDIYTVEEIHYDKETLEAVYSEKTYDKLKESVVVEREWREKMEKDEFEAEWGSIDSGYRLQYDGDVKEFKNKDTEIKYEEIKK